MNAETRPENPAAFPQSEENVRRSYTIDPADPGMSLRDYFAAKAMQAFAATGIESSSHCALLAYQQADAMLAERSKQK